MTRARHSVNWGGACCRWVGATALTAIALVTLAITASQGHAVVDLRIESLGPVADGDGLQAGVTSEVLVKVVNEGDEPAGPFTVSVWHNRVPLPVDPADADDSATIEGLAPGAASAVTLPFEVTYPAASVYILWAWVDSGSAVSESDETNNQLPTLLEVGGDLPDLIVQSVVPESANAEVGAPVKVAVTIKNQGNLAAAPCQVNLWRNNSGTPSHVTPTDLQADLAALAPGGTATVTLEVTYEAAGTFTLWAMVDYSRRVLEGNDRNNTAFAEVTVSGDPIDGGDGDDDGDGDGSGGDDTDGGSTPDDTDDDAGGGCGQAGTTNLPVLGAISLLCLAGMKRIGRQRR